MVSVEMATLGRREEVKKMRDDQFPFDSAIFGGPKQGNTFPGSLIRCTSMAAGSKSSLSDRFAIQAHRLARVDAIRKW